MADWFRKYETKVPDVKSREQEADDLIARAEALRAMGEAAPALDLYRTAYKLVPARVDTLYALASLAQETGDLPRARMYAEKGLALDPRHLGLHVRMGSIAHLMTDSVLALKHFRHAASLDGATPDVLRKLADQLVFTGRADEGIAVLGKALAGNPDSMEIAQARLFCLNYSCLFSPEAIADEHRAWGRKVESAIRGRAKAAASTHTNKPVLKVGYVSADLRHHAVANFMLPLLCNHDRERFGITVLDNSSNPEDATTASLREHVPEWHRVKALSDDALASLIRQLEIDILVDLSGHSAGNRLAVFARKPAPVQVSWLGYLGTTGLSAMDYRFTDAFMDPPGMTEGLHVEELVRLPVQACFAPNPGTPQPEPSPVARGQPLTFGSVNQWPKVSPEAKDLWSGILTAFPDARLFVIARGGQNPEFRRAIAAEFEERGVRREQIEVFPFMPTEDFLKFLGRIDVALDPFPYGGGTSTLQCLWMGVPVVTLAGRTAMSRNSVGALNAVGLADLVAATATEYREKAIALGGDHQRLSQLRIELRGRLSTSAWTDGLAFAKSVENAYRAMWRRHSDSAAPGGRGS